jgi:Mn2+/Fe2+ NRAMP family transporter
MKRIWQSIGPAIVVAAVVLGPGSILTSSKVGAGFGLTGVPVIAMATVLMIAMVALAARIGVIYERSACEELAARLGRPAAIGIGLILYVLVALFQSSNNLAVVAGLAPLAEMFTKGEPIGLITQINLLVLFNAFVILCLYRMRSLYGSIERLMKLLIAVMVAAFLFNFAVAWLTPRGPITPPTERGDLFALLGMIGTTFSVAGAFYQSYLVREKGWGLAEARRGVLDSILSISVLGMVTMIILLTAYRTFYGLSPAVTLASVDDVARQMEPLFGAGATVVFCLGIIAGAFSSFLINSMIGGTVMSDALGKGSRLSQPWPLHLTTVSLLVGMGVAIASLASAGSTVALITFAQALTVLGIPALAAALLYLGTRAELTGERRVPRWIVGLAWLGLVVSILLAVRTALAVWEKWFG